MLQKLLHKKIEAKLRVPLIVRIVCIIAFGCVFGDEYA